MCIRTKSASDCPHASNAPGLDSARTSLMISTLNSNAAAITAAVLVSTEMAIGKRFLIASITGNTRSNSSASETRSAPGRVDSPPISITSAPASIIISAWRSAASRSKNKPPSENESGVTLRIPMTSGPSAILSLSDIGPTRLIRRQREHFLNRDLRRIQTPCRSVRRVAHPVHHRSSWMAVSAFDLP